MVVILLVVNIPGACYASTLSSTNVNKRTSPSATSLYLITRPDDVNQLTCVLAAISGPARIITSAGTSFS